MVMCGAAAGMHQVWCIFYAFIYDVVPWRIANA